MADQPDTLLGKATDYPVVYSPGILQGISRSEGRALLSVNDSNLPFSGADLWTLYELSWLDQNGKPHVGIGEISIPCDSPFIVESKSLKLYLNSLNEHRFSSITEVLATLTTDLGAICGAPVSAEIFTVDDYTAKGLRNMPGICLDKADVHCNDNHANPNPSLLSLLSSDEVVEETLYSHLLKSNCPVTGQPDWASVQISYRGNAINREGLLAYIISFHHHQAFHEQCVEQIFMDVYSACDPEQLTIIARYTRRGGIDINPLRSLSANVPQSWRISRQ